MGSGLTSDQPGGRAFLVLVDLSLLNHFSGVTPTSSNVSGQPVVASNTGSDSQLQSRGMFNMMNQLLPINKCKISGLCNNLLTGYLAVIDEFGIYPIPQPSSSHPIQLFEVQHLQRAGLLNTGNICCHISIVLCFHRLGLLKYLEEDLIVANGNVLDWSAFFMQRSLEAIPSRIAFSIQNMLTAWNNDGKLPQLQEWDDISVVDEITTQLPFRGMNNIPVFTIFSLRYTCPACGNVENDCNERVFSTVPTLKLLPGSVPISAERLLLDSLREPVQTRCNNSSCGGPVVAFWKTKPGKATLLFIARNHDHEIVHTRLIPRAPSGPAPGIMGELVSVVSRTGEIQRGHYFSYHQVGGRWFKNNDDHPMTGVDYHPFHLGSVLEEDPVLLCYSNNV